MSDSDSDVVQELFASDSWQRKLIRSDTNKAIECWQNVFYVLQNHPAWKNVLAFDSFAQMPVKRKDAPTGACAGPWSAEDDTLLGLWLAQQMKLTIKSLGNISTGALACAQANPFHPVTAWLDSLVWDETERLPFWMSDCLGVKRSPYAMAVGTYFIMNLVARVYEPGCIMRSVPVLEGAQERGKSTALRMLVGDAWFSDSHFDVSGKDSFELIQGVWLYEISEMESFNKAESGRVKQFVSSIKDSWVPKYIRGRVTARRQVCFAGTVNEFIYQKDWTGTTRFWPLRCEAEGNIDLDLINTQREQLFAEAVVRVRRGDRRFPTAEEYRDLFLDEQEARVVHHPWREPIFAWLDLTTREKVTAYEILSEVIKVETAKMTLLNQQDVGRIMQAAGWERKRESDGLRKWYYAAPEKPKQEHRNGSDIEADPF